MRFTTAIFSTVSALALVSSAAPTAGLSVERSITRPKSNIVSRPSTPRYKVRGQRRHSSSKNRVRRQRRQSDGDLSSGVLSPTGPVGKTTTALLGNRGSSVSDGEDPNEDLLISVSNVAEEIPAELNDVTNTAQEIIEDVTNTVKEIIDDVTTVASDPSSSLVGIENEARTAALRHVRPRRSKKRMQKQRRQSSNQIEGTDVASSAGNGILGAASDLGDIAKGLGSLADIAASKIDSGSIISGAEDVLGRFGGGLLSIGEDAVSGIGNALGGRDASSLQEEYEAARVNELLKFYQETAATTSDASSSGAHLRRDLAEKDYSPGFSERTDALRKRIDEIQESFKYMEKTVMTLGALDPIATTKKIRELAEELEGLQQGLDFEIAKNLAACSLNGATQQSL